MIVNDPNTSPIWKVPLSDIDLGDLEKSYVNQVLDSRWLSMGETTQKFETEFSQYLGVKHAIAVSNGTTALHLACASLELKDGDEVIMPSLSFVATANAVLYTGATPVFAEISGEMDLCISPVEIEKKITPNTRAIMVMHYGGNLCNMNRIIELANQYDLPIVEDAAYAPGAKLDGRMAGTFGALGCFSFFANKNLVTGEGGMVVTNQDDLANHIRLMRSHGMTSLTWDRHKGHASTYDVIELGYNYRIDEIRAALGLAQLQFLSRNNQQRQNIISQYILGLSDIPEIVIPFQTPTGISAGHLFVILLPKQADRGQFIQQMKLAGIQTSIHYPPIHLFTYYRRRFGYKPGDLPLTEEIASRVVTLPLFPRMSPSQVELVISALHRSL